MKWAMFTWLVIAVAAVSFVCDRRTRELEVLVKIQQEQIEKLEVRCAAYDDIMATYKFFNEHWTATMRGERNAK